MKKHNMILLIATISAVNVKTALFLVAIAAFTAYIWSKMNHWMKHTDWENDWFAQWMQDKKPD